ncbi:uncharacterized protein LOC123822431 [Phyllostomus hastatus]|uniref:uncharacterized protein LOC123822431 n=1 Tax=Phyllostomus hastatus TaxID=9423 RepID=UPI001E67EEF8|nr:uncharacterized protein LOC123822431 [Phyllostomus hastatus]
MAFEEPEGVLAAEALQGAAPGLGEQGPDDQTHCTPKPAQAVGSDRCKPRAGAGRAWSLPISKTLGSPDRSVNGKPNGLSLGSSEPGGDADTFAVAAQAPGRSFRPPPPPPALLLEAVPAQRCSAVIWSETLTGAGRPPARPARHLEVGLADEPVLGGARREDFTFTSPLRRAPALRLPAAAGRADRRQPGAGRWCGRARQSRTRRCSRGTGACPPGAERRWRHSGSFRLMPAPSEPESDPAGQALTSRSQSCFSGDGSPAGATRTGPAGVPELRPVAEEWLGVKVAIHTQGRSLDSPGRPGLQNTLFPAPAAGGHAPAPPRTARTCGFVTSAGASPDFRP